MATTRTQIDVWLGSAKHHKAEGTRRPDLVYEYAAIGATGKTGRHTVQHLLEKGHAVRAMVHKEDERSEALRRTGVEVVTGELLEHDDVIQATAGACASYFCYPVSPGLIQATAYFADAARRAALEVVVNMSQISAREDCLDMHT